MSHSAPIALPWGRESVAYFSKKNANTLLVFVHGFGGQASATWAGTETHLIQAPQSANSDIVYFGYKSMTAQPEISAGILREFLNEATDPSRKKWNDLIRRSVGNGQICRDYERVLLIAHSLGASITRRALLDANIKGHIWAQNCQMLLFAPAHCGARIPEIIEAAALSNKLLFLLYKGINFFAQSLQSLNPGSPFLTNLHADSLAQYQAGIYNQNIVVDVIFGENENIVWAQNFLYDPPAKIWNNEDHSSVCRCTLTTPTIAGHI